MLVLARIAVGTSAFAESEFAALEVLLELMPLLVRGLAVLRLRALGTALLEEGPVGTYELFVEDRHVRLGGVEVGVAE